MRKKLAHLLRTVADKLTKEETCDLGIGKCIKKPTTTAKAKEQMTNSILLAPYRNARSSYAGWCAK